MIPFHRARKILSRATYSLLWCLCLLLSAAMHAQTFSGTGGMIPDYANAQAFFINVSALDSSVLNSRYGLKKICIDISHPRVSDIGVYLIAPDGTQVELTSGAGGNGANYSSTCFDMAASTTILSGTAPFTGTYYPRHNIGEVNNGQVGTGIWRLMVQDVVPGDTGQVNSWSLSFGISAPAPIGIATGLCNPFNAPGCGCPDSSQSNCWLEPDMLIGEEWFTDTLRRKEFHDSITVSNATANIGYGPMEIIGTGLWFCGDSQVAGSGQCPNGSYARQQVKQRIYVKTQNGFFTFVDSVVGTMSFHAELGHRHLHVDDWTENTLRIRGPESDPSLWPIIGRGYKNSMNLYDHVKCDSVFFACDYNNVVYERDKLRNGGLGIGYNSGSAQVQGISVGYADIYEYLLPYGQAIYFDSICNGDYILMAQFDPRHHFLDMRPENNITWFPVTLTQQNSGCCKTRFEIDTIDYARGIFRFIDRSTAIPAGWHWSFGDGDTSASQFPYHQFQTEGYHTIRLHTTTAQGCSGSDTFRLLVPQSVGITSEPDTEPGISIYPNPSNGRFTLSCMYLIAEPQISIYNTLGQLIPIAITPQTIAADLKSYTIEIAAKGLYLIDVNMGGEHRHLKVVNK